MSIEGKGKSNQSIFLITEQSFFCLGLVVLEKCYMPLAWLTGLSRSRPFLQVNYAS